MKERVINSLKEAAERTGLDKFIIYGVVIGGFVFNSEKAADLDILIVLNEGSKNNPDIIEKLKKFSIEHVIVQIENGLTPDWDFPTYFVTQQQIDETLHGRPFTIDEKGEICLKKYSPEEWIRNPESDYNVMLFQLISHDMDLFYGSSNQLEADTEKALLNIFFYTYQVFGYAQNESVNQMNLCQDFFRSSGLKYVITNKLQNILWRVLKVHHLGSLQNGNFFFDHQAIQKQFKLFTDSFYSAYVAKHLFGWGDMSRNVKKLVRGEKMIEKFYNSMFNAKTHKEEWNEWHDRTKQQMESINRREILPKEIIDKEEIRYYKSLHDSIVEMLPLGNNDISDMLEIGSGSGVLSLLLSKTFKCNSTLLDNSQVAIQYASLINKESQMILGDATRMPFADNVFDFVHSVGLIEHFDDITIYRMIGEAKRTLKKGGYFYLAVPNFFSPDLLSIWSKYGKGTEKHIPPSELSQYVQRLGFEVIKGGYSEYVSGFFSEHNMLGTEKVLGRAGLGFLDYVLCKK